MKYSGKLDPESELYRFLYILSMKETKAGYFLLMKQR